MAALIACVIAALSLASPSRPILEEAEAIALAVRERLLGPRQPPADLVLVTIDDADLATEAGWPIDRRYWARLVDALATAGARTIVLDTLLATRSLQNAADDERLADALKRHGAVALPLELLAQATTTPVPDGVAPFAIVSMGERDRLPAHGGLIPPPPSIADAAAAMGPSILEVAPGGLPRLPAAVDVGGRLVPSLAVDVVRLHRALASGDLHYDGNRGALVDGVALAPAEAGRYWLRAYGPPGTIRTVSARQALTGIVDLKGALVVVGIDAPAVGERFDTPFSMSVSGGEVLATAIGNVLEGDTLRRWSPTAPGSLALAGLAAAGAAWALGRGRPSTSLVGAAALLAVLFAVSYAALAAGAWLPLVVPVLTMLTAGLLIEATRLVYVQRHERELAFERQNLSRFFPPAVADRLAGTTTPGALDATVDATVVFIDVVGSSALVERLDPADAMAVFRRFFLAVEAEVFDESGTLVTFLGDGALVVFGVPEPRADAPTAAVRTAHRLLERLKADALDVRIGIHSGPLLVGNIGGVRQFQFTVMGDTVHVASRLQGLAQNLDAAIVCSAATLAAVDDKRLYAGFSFVPAVSLRGRQQAIDLWYLKRVIR